MNSKRTFVPSQSVVITLLQHVFLKLLWTWCNSIFTTLQCIARDYKNCVLFRRPHCFVQTCLHKSLILMKIFHRGSGRISLICLVVDTFSSCNVWELLLHTFASVSYTHLDVYKRQSVSRDWKEGTNSLNKSKDKIVILINELTK